MTKFYRLVSYILVFFSGIVFTYVLQRTFKVETQYPFWTKEFPGIWLGPMLTGWCIGQMMAREKVFK